ncbi:tRNA (N6-isopentenyl adenosine(37)-C2)-methylthiotransferase MiaB [candidate division LCP-89 bacterium B3_LCP]|uniref:tRNA-2-methylthio-N(6)-dimethylallyladenosine synthase n=1 Tax=candidate division LCP-89 bacterium B3_LCP TaxID=2012998 RepID=A0A532V3W5_UNCL8|nr:MAG: tRNA (N6-isopentenyl adenosine(37)-C2)-methylthiotransferase MiaB [candidate division LCP-89 bacterium B3_LCP]
MKVFIDTYGCQMNVYDGELVTGLLLSDGFGITQEAEDADVILINTCSVRDHAEQRALGRLRSLGALKRKQPHLVLGVLGCMAERMQETILKTAPDVDLIAGPDSYRQLPEIIRKHLNGSFGKFSIVPGDAGEDFTDIMPSRGNGINAYMAIMRGCNNYCSYCIVPHVRGRERSRHPDDIIIEIERSVEEGFPEVTLLGQNVNSYKWSDLGFHELLDRVSRVSGLKRIRFLTSHPRDLSEELIERMVMGGNICPSLHLPVQAGSDRILKLMKRRYTRSEYVSKIHKLREAVPDIAITTDLLCGFPGETENDFQQTLDLIGEVRFDDAFTFKYSPRPGTAAAAMEDDVPEAEKVERLERMIALCRKYSDNSRKEMIGREVEVLMESVSPKNASEWTGRTGCGRVTLVPGAYKQGQLVRLKVEKVLGFSLWGNPVLTV